MNVIDSSAWLEYFGDGANASEFAAAIEDTSALVVPSLTLFEVFGRTCAIAEEATALEEMGVMLQGTVVELTTELALEAARLSHQTGLAMADSIILATARSAGATLWTQDAHFEGMDGVEFRAKPGSADWQTHRAARRRRKMSRCTQRVLMPETLTGRIRPKAC